ncbi:MAG: hypothetical protein H6707_17065 [Deltaproteobacteria bacterium]|nr:hypothetical protein [Deltaproteobacteria bacterium]
MSHLEIEHAKRLCLKLPIIEPSPAASITDGAIAVFHQLIQRQALDKELMIDVVDYRHLAQGSQVLLICHHSHYALDFADGVAGLLYRDRRAQGSLSERLSLGLSRLKAMAEAIIEPLALGFAGDRLLLRLEDRLWAPNRSEVAQQAQTVIARALEAAGHPDSAVVALEEDRRRALGFSVKLQRALIV